MYGDWEGDLTRIPRMWRGEGGVTDAQGVALVDERRKAASKENRTELQLLCSPGNPRFFFFF